GWGIASARYREVKWIEALLSARSEIDEHQENLFQALPKENQQQYLLRLMRANPSLLPTNQTLWYLEACLPPWSEDLSRALLESLRDHIKKGDFVTDYGMSAWLNRIGRSIHHPLIPEVISGLSAAFKPGIERTPAFDRFFDLIQFRYEMLQEFEE